MIAVFGLVLPVQKQTVKTTSFQAAKPHKTIAKPAFIPIKTQTVAAATPAPASAPAVASRPAVAPAAPAPRTIAVQPGTPKAEPVVKPAPSSNVSGLTPTAAVGPAGSPAPSAAQSPAPATTTGYRSTNWSGYLATNASFTAISGSWTATSPTGNGSTTSADSTWIGIGGVTSDDLIQTGTQNIVSASGQVSTAAFYEILPASSQPVPGLSVSPGDSMSASITETASGQWRIIITDNTDQQSDTINLSYSSSLSSAEWIEEDPSYSAGRQIPFDNFNRAAFTSGTVVANGLTLTIAASTAQPVTMVTGSGQVIAEPSTIGANGQSFTVTP